MLNENGACHMMVSLVLQLCMFLGIAMGKILCYDNCMMKNILKNRGLIFYGIAIVKLALLPVQKHFVVV